MNYFISFAQKVTSNCANNLFGCQKMLQHEKYFAHKSKVVVAGASEPASEQRNSNMLTIRKLYKAAVHLYS